MRDAGCKFYCIDPMHTDTAEVLGAEWVPIRPGTDIAFLMACAYVMITEDDPKSNPLIDWDVVNRCSIGFDAESMPEAPTQRGTSKTIFWESMTVVPKIPSGQRRFAAFLQARFERLPMCWVWKTRRPCFVDGVRGAATT